MNVSDSSPHTSAHLISQMARSIQSTLISNTITKKRWEEHIAQCLKYGFHAAMIPPCWVKQTAEALKGSEVRVASFIDFPLGTMTSAGKAYEAGRLAQDGVNEIDLMPNVGFLLSGMEREYADDISGVVKAAAQIPVKIMLELPLLTPEQANRAIALSIDAGVVYLKNASSGAVGVATPEQIRFLRRVAPANIRIKASGGIKSAKQVQELLAAGADLAGTSAGARIMAELQGDVEGQEQEPSSY